MVQRDIRRAAFLLGAPHVDNLALVDEVAAKGYQDVAIFVMPPGAGWTSDAADLDTARRIAERVRSHDLRLVVATCYSKNMKLYLQDHPEQRLTTRGPGGHRQDVRRGCPFHPDYKAQHATFLRQAAALPALQDVWIDDEARLGFTPNDYGCYCTSCRAQFRAASGYELPDTIDWQSPVWRAFVRWRLRMWTDVHNDLAAVIHAVAPAVKVLFQTTPLVDLMGTNPWPTAIDLGAMAVGLDGMSADPYYAATESAFRPRQTYLSHWTRFLRGHVPRQKGITICMGFSNPASAYHPREEDGYWNGLLPLAAGADQTVWLFYDLQRFSRTIASYEATFKLDPYFARVEPLRYVGVVHSFQSEVWRYAQEAPGGGNYDWTYVVPLAELLRTSGVPFGYVADARLEPAELAGYQALLLPSVGCLSATQRETLRGFIGRGGGTVAWGELDVADEWGVVHGGSSLAQELFGISGFKALGEGPSRREAPPTGNSETDPTRLSPFAPSPLGLLGVRVARADHPIFAGYDPSRDPQIRLVHCLATDGVAPGEVLATFVDDRDQDTGIPAIVASERAGSRHAYFAGLPTASYAAPDRGMGVFNPAPRIFRNAVNWVAPTRPALSLEGFPPRTDYQQARPDDVRAITTVEFLPLIGDDLLLACFASYAYEQYGFRLVAQIPPDRRIRSVCELLTRAAVPYTVGAGQATVEVHLTPMDAAKVLCIELEGTRE